MSRLSRPAPCAVHGAAGFTLVEIVIMMAILGLVLALVLPRTARAGNLSSASRQLIGMVRSLYVAASATQKVYRLYLDLDQRSYWVVTLESDGERPPADAILAQRQTLPGGIRFRDITTVAQGKVGVGRAAMQFYPAGRTDRTVIHLTDEAQTTMTLSVNPLTGVVQVQDGNIDPPLAQPMSDQFRQLLLPGPTGIRG
jgi:type II secretory pathway pseudopilin PulG